LYALLALRDRIVKRTALTTLERLIMPIRGAVRTHLALGYVHRAYPEVYASLAMQAGYDSVLLLKGVEGGLAPALNKPVRRYYCQNSLPEDIETIKDTLAFESFSDQRAAALVNDDARPLVEQTLETGMAVLDGAQGTARNSLVLAAGHLLFSLQPSLSLPNAVEKVQDCLDNGSAKAYFDSQIGSAA
jgi:anthranilate phosphoribosyltransferase